MKRILALLLAAGMTLSLFGCSGKQPQQPDQPNTPDFPDSPPQTEISPLPEGPLYLLTAEYERLYCVNAKGESVLLRDDHCVSYDRRGDQVLAAFSSGEIYLFDLTANTQELVTTAEYAAYSLNFLRNGFYYSCGSIEESFYRVYDFASGETHELPSYYAWGCEATDDYLAYFSWSENAASEAVYLYDLNTYQLAAEIPISSPSQILNISGTLYVRADDYNSNQSVWYRVDPEHLSAVPVKAQLPNSSSAILACGNGYYLLNSNYYNSIHPGYYLWKNGKTTLTPLPNDNDSWVIPCDERNGVFLLSCMTSHSVEGATWEDYLYYSTSSYVLFDTADGSFTDISFASDTARLFADGDFPVIDSSTARKPVTRSIYSLFCLQSEVGGAEPLCSTTHGAWLNIADGKADLALLAAPTAEEEAYLAEKGVKVDMKLYGGDGLVFIGNSACGVTDLTLDQVRGIYRGEITNWSQLGGADAEIHVLYRDDQSGSQRLFEKLLWKDEAVPDFDALDFELLDEMSTIVSSCIYDPYAIGYSIMTYLNDVYSNEELLAFSLNGVNASPEEVAANNYPLGTQGYAVIRADEAENSPARRLYNWIGSPMCDELLEYNSVSPLH